MNEQNSYFFREDENRFLTPDGVGTEELFLNSKFFESGLECRMEYDLLSIQGQMQEENERADFSRFNQVTSPSVSFVEEELNSNKFFNVDLNFLVDSTAPEQSPSIPLSSSTYCVSEVDCYSGVFQSRNDETNLQDIYADLPYSRFPETRGVEKQRIAQTCLVHSDLQLSQDNFMCSSISAGNVRRNSLTDPALSVLDHPFRSISVPESFIFSEESSREYRNCNVRLSMDPESSVVNYCFDSNRKGLSKRRNSSHSSYQEIPSSVDDFESWRLEIYSLLKYRGLSRREFAKIARIGKNTVGKYLSGHCKRVSKEVVNKMLYAFHILQSRDRTEFKVSQTTRSHKNRRLSMKQREDSSFSNSSFCSPIETEWDRINRTSLVEMENIKMEDIAAFHCLLFSDGQEPKATTPLDALKSDSFYSCNPCHDVSTKQKSEPSQAVSTDDEKTKIRLFPSYSSLRTVSEELQCKNSGIAEHEQHFNHEKEHLILRLISSDVENDEVENWDKCTATSVQNEFESNTTKNTNEQIQDLVEQGYYRYSEPFQEPPSVICFVPLQIEVHIPCDEVHEERNFSTLYSWRWGDKRQTVDSVASEIAEHYKVPSRYEDILKKCIQNALARHGLIGSVQHATSSRTVRLDLDLGDSRHHSEEFHVDYPWPENFPYILARQICMDLNVNPQHVERIAVNILEQLNVGD
ncbi:hypothetical protein Gasu2_36330 [Galdieria sulphuraria]|nr:hypothetical protein Gasu2_36330 [Galdieria sulphuraria]